MIVETEFRVRGAREDLEGDGVCVFEKMLEVEGENVGCADVGVKQGVGGTFRGAIRWWS